MPKRKTKKEAQDSQTQHGLVDHPKADNDDADDEILIEEDEEDDDDLLLEDENDETLEDTDAVLGDDEELIGDQELDQYSCTDNSSSHLINLAISQSLPLADANLDSMVQGQEDFSVVPKWLAGQIRAGLQKVIRLHMIRRVLLKGHHRM
jgi:hypothetical protein